MTEAEAERLDALAEAAWLKFEKTRDEAWAVFNKIREDAYREYQQTTQMLRKGLQ